MSHPPDWKTWCSRGFAFHCSWIALSNISSYKSNLLMGKCINKYVTPFTHTENMIFCISYCAMTQWFGCLSNSNIMLVTWSEHAFPLWSHMSTFVSCITASPCCRSRVCKQTASPCSRSRVCKQYQHCCNTNQIHWFWKSYLWLLSQVCWRVQHGAAPSSNFELLNFPLKAMSQ